MRSWAFLVFYGFCCTLHQHGTMLWFSLFKCQCLTQKSPEATELEQGNGSPSSHSTTSWVIQKSCAPHHGLASKQQPCCKGLSKTWIPKHTKKHVAFTHGWLISIQTGHTFGFVFRVKSFHSDGECSSFLSEGQLTICYFLRSSFSQAHLYNSAHAYLGCPRQFWHSCQTCFTANIKVNCHQPNYNAMFALEGGRYTSLEVIRSQKREKQWSAKKLCNEFIFGWRHLNKLSQNKHSEANSFLLLFNSLCTFSFFLGCFSCTMTSDSSKQCLQTRHCWCFVNMWNEQEKLLGVTN